MVDSSDRIRSQVPDTLRIEFARIRAVWGVRGSPVDRAGEPGGVLRTPRCAAAGSGQELTGGGTLRASSPDGAVAATYFVQRLAEAATPDGPAVDRSPN